MKMSFFRSGRILVKFSQNFIFEKIDTNGKHADFERAIERQIWFTKHLRKPQNKCVRKFWPTLYRVTSLFQRNFNAF
jgi:hypothetical protein